MCGGNQLDDWQPRSILELPLLLSVGSFFRGKQIVEQWEGERTLKKVIAVQSRGSTSLRRLRKASSLKLRAPDF